MRGRDLRARARRRRARRRDRGGRRAGPAGGQSPAAHPGPAGGTPLRRLTRDRDRALARDCRRCRAAGGRRRPRHAAAPQGPARRLRRPRPGPRGRRGRHPRGHRTRGPAGGNPAPRRARARVRGRALDHHGAGGRRHARRLPDLRQPPRRGDPGGVDRPGSRAPRGDDGGSGDRRGRCRGARRGRRRDRRAVPPRRRVARGQRDRAPRPQLRPLDDRGRPDQPVRAARPGDLRPAARRPGGATARRPWSTCSEPARRARRG